jgi:hypothetical protein
VSLGRVMTYEVSFMSFVDVAPSFAMHFFQADPLAILCFFHVLKDELKATVLAWCPDNDSVTDKYPAEMRRLARDETSFLSVV